MDVFSNILLTVFSILYLSVVSDTSCPCFQPGNVIAERMLLGHNTKCLTDLRSRKIANRQICPTRSQINFDPKRTPKYLTEKKCCNKECAGGNGHTCEEFRVPIGVTYHELDGEGREVIRPETIHLSVTCVCAAPRKLPEPPKK